MRELSLHILDIARNTLEAGATELDIEVCEALAEDRLTLALRDNGRGMDPTTLAQAMDPFYTTRTTRRIGLGLSLLRATCERCEGQLAIQSRPGEGTRVAGSLRLSHLDRPPLGDMGAVMQALACEAEQIAVRYRHVVDGRTFELDTAQLKEELEEVPLASPSVLRWLGTHVNAQLRVVGSRA